MVTSIEQIKQKAIKEVEISGFEIGDTITLQLKGISLTNLIQSGKIPNQLMGTAIELFEGKKKDGKKDKDDHEKLPDTIKMVDIICESAMVDPKFEDVKEYLTDTQKMEIFTFTQGGVDALNSFRKVQSLSKFDSHSDNIPLPS